MTRKRLGFWITRDMDGTIKLWATDYEPRFDKQELVWFSVSSAIDFCELPEVLCQKALGYVPDKGKKVKVRISLADMKEAPK